MAVARIARKVRLRSSDRTLSDDWLTPMNESGGAFNGRPRELRTRIINLPICRINPSIVLSRYLHPALGKRVPVGYWAGGYICGDRAQIFSNDNAGTNTRNGNCEDRHVVKTECSLAAIADIAVAINSAPIRYELPCWHQKRSPPAPAQICNVGHSSSLPQPAGDTLLQSSESVTSRPHLEGTGFVRCAQLPPASRWRDSKAFGR
jgi:hypothetical protein